MLLDSLGKIETKTIDGLRSCLDIRPNVGGIKYDEYIFQRRELERQTFCHYSCFHRETMSYQIVSVNVILLASYRVDDNSVVFGREFVPKAFASGITIFLFF